MKTMKWIKICLLVSLLATSGWAQTANRFNSSLNRMSVDGREDMSKLKLLAERGFVDAQLKVARACMTSHLYADALKWYTAAADQGVVEAGYQRGHMLLFGCDGTSADQVVAAKPSEGLKSTFMAATNHNYNACFDMARALKDGIGCPADPVAAYAWYSYCADNGSEPSRAAMNELALRISMEDIRQSLARSREIKAGHWPEFSLLAAPTHHTTTLVGIKLKLSGVVYSPRGNLAVINNHTMSEGETSQLATDHKELVSVTCEHIQSGYVEVRVEGEAESRTLVAGN